MDSAPGALPRIAIIDHHDSYTRNFLSLLTACVSLPVTDKLLAERVVVIPHTHPALKPENFHRHLLPHLDALILSPGPGKPTEELDFGTSARLLRHAELVQMPVLGVCLGHQGIAASFGGRIKCLSEPVHGIKRKLTMVADEPGRQRPYGAKNILEGVPDGTGAICYNSLVVDEASLPPEIRVTAWATESSEPRIIQALEHERLPYFGVQFHPESIESSGGNKILDNFLYNIHAYWNDVDSSRPEMWRQESCRLPQWIHELGGACMLQGAGPTLDPKMPHPPLRWRIKEYTFPLRNGKPLEATLAHDSPRILDRLFRKPASQGGCFWLDSASARDAQSQYSFMGTCDFVLSYNVARELYACVRPLPDGLPQRAKIEMQRHTGLWDWMDALQGALQERTLIERVQTHVPDGSCRFRTGFVGFWSYEMKDESLGLGMSTEKQYEHSTGNTPFDRLALPLSEWGFCNKVLMLNHLTGTWTAFVLEKLNNERATSTHPLDTLEQTLDEMHRATKSAIGVSPTEASGWIAHVQRVLDETCSTPEGCSPAPKLLNQPLPPLHALDNKETYMGKVQRAREFIRAGESYELCLTTQFEGSVPSLESGQYDACFQLYQKLRKKNPAPFGAYLELNRSDSGKMQAVLSTSPERFLTVDHDGRCEMRPIKGTVVRPGWGHGEREWIEKAKHDESAQCFLQEEDERRKLKLCQDKKECAENLMIADLIRADLQSVCFPTSVQVPRLIAIETYETVHQLVTSVTGQLRPGIKCVETTKRCFPPGSMTGAPKRRSTELLEQLEHTPGSSTKLTRRRGVYSGAVGFVGVDGASNLSVAIRTATVQGNNVTVGAGGAVTYLSTPEGEWAEVLHKLGSVSTLASDV